MLDEAENRIRELLHNKSDEERHELWSLCRLVDEKNLWLGRHKNFIAWMKNLGIGSSTAYQMRRAGKAVDILAVNPNFKASNLPMPTKLSLAENLSSYPPCQIFDLWESHCTNGTPIDKLECSLRPNVNRPSHGKNSVNRSFHTKSAANDLTQTQSLN